MKLRILHLTDPHIGTPGAIQFGADPRLQFEKTLAQAVLRKPDLVVLTGDLSMDQPDDLANIWIKHQLDATGLDYHVVAGNHDDADAIANLFHKNSERKYYYTKRYNTHQIVFLDTSTARLQNDQWNWLSEVIKKADQPIYIFCHHPPFYCGVPHMDSHYPFIEQDKFLSLMRHTQEDVHIFCGHYHNARSVSLDHINLNIAPSTLFQIDASISDFKIEHTMPGYQYITLFDQRVAKSVHFIHD